MNGVIYVAYGRAACQECRYSVESLRRYHDWPIAIVCRSKIDIPDVKCITFTNPGPGARRAKLNITKLAPKAWKNILYLDADTRVRGDLSAGFEVLADGWDVALTFSQHQVGNEFLWHVGDEERQTTLDELGNPFPLQFGAGVMFVARNDATARLFAAWREEWERWHDQDQAALLRALCREPVRAWTLGRDWNGGSRVKHYFGRARGNDWQG